MKLSKDFCFESCQIFPESPSSLTQVVMPMGFSRKHSYTDDRGLRIRTLFLDLIPVEFQHLSCTPMEFRQFWYNLALALMEFSQFWLEFLWNSSRLFVHPYGISSKITDTTPMEFPCPQPPAGVHFFLAGFRVDLENLENLEKVPFLRKLRENLENSGKEF